MDWSLAFGIVVSASLIAMACLIILTVLRGGATQKIDSIFAGVTPQTVFLFDGEVLVDATPSARAMLAEAAEERTVSAWIAVLSRLEPMFPGLVMRIEAVQREGQFVLCSRQDVRPTLMLRAEYLGGLTRLTLLESGADGVMAQNDGAALTAMQQEIAELRSALAAAPMPIWRESTGGEVVWANSAYLCAASLLIEPGHEMTWPLPVLFPRDGVEGGRRALKTGSATDWFELVVVPVRDERIIYAQPANKLVQAEVSLRDFMQTLAKTFAHLSIGLAIFDARRVLQLFNPALIDLTGLSAEFLIARPTLPALLDEMREKAMIPEPKDYRSWRRRIVELEEAAASGLFEETWTLPSGQTYRVTGRPHPGGALAFMFEDISTEMTRTRRYRAELEVGQAVIDAMDDAVVVFAQDGSIAMSNRAAAQLWPGAETAFVPVTGEPGVITLWREMTAPTLLWSDLANYIGTFGTREPWNGELRLKDGRPVTCRVSPMPHGSTLVAFRLAGGRAEVAEGGPDQAIMVA